MLHMPNFIDGGADNTQFVRGTSGHIASWFSIVNITVWMVPPPTPPTKCLQEPVSVALFEKSTFADRIKLRILR